MRRRDTYRFFQAPVTDEVAPQYSSIISYAFGDREKGSRNGDKLMLSPALAQCKLAIPNRHPMDMSTMRDKIERGAYSTMQEYLVRFPENTAQRSIVRQLPHQICARPLSHPSFLLFLLQEDFLLMIRNCHHYNQPGSLVYEEASKLDKASVGGFP